ncbi:MAG: hypothetical protein AABX05_04090 [Nanoarchaeota archaeon]
MELRELKKEVNSLSDLSKAVQHFQDNWIKPIKNNTNRHIPFLQEFKPALKQELNKKMAALQPKIQNLSQAQTVNHKLQEYARCLIELKLTTLNGNTAKASYVTKLLLHDEYLNTSNLIDEIKNLERQAKEINKEYHQINELVQKNIALDEGVNFMDMPHQKYIQEITSTIKKQKVLVKQLGEEFVILAKETRRKK